MLQRKVTFVKRVVAYGLPILVGAGYYLDEWIQRFRSSSPRRFSKARAEADLLRECLGPAELGGEKFRSLTKAALITVFSAWRWLGSLPRRCGTCGPISGPTFKRCGPMCAR